MNDDRKAARRALKAKYAAMWRELQTKQASKLAALEDRDEMTQSVIQ
jgi:hypothetical protein